MKQNTISTKIRFIGILFIVLMTSIIVTTMYLNEKNKKDALLINIAGKQRMLTQNISKKSFLDILVNISHYSIFRLSCQAKLQFILFFFEKQSTC